MLTFPIIRIDRVWHVGTFENFVAADRPLAVSWRPVVWQRIAHLQGLIWMLERRGARFLDVYALDAEQRGSIAKWTTRQRDLGDDGYAVAWARAAGLDGVWWRDHLSISGGRAPHGCIFARHVLKWSRELAVRTTDEWYAKRTVPRAQQHRIDEPRHV